MSEVKSIAVIGAGAMGSGIALTAAMSGLKVWQIDVSDHQLDRAKNYHSKTLKRSVEKERISQSDSEAVLARIEHSTELGPASESDWVVEAATEDAKLKKQIFGLNVAMNDVAAHQRRNVEALKSGHERCSVVPGHGLGQRHTAAAGQDFSTGAVLQYKVKVSLVLISAEQPNPRKEHGAVAAAKAQQGRFLPEDVLRALLAADLGFDD